MKLRGGPVSGFRPRPVFYPDCNYCVMVSAYVPLGNGNIALNLLIAAVMIVLLVIFLMDLRSAKALIRIVALAGLLWLILMFTLTFNDYLSRYY
jgi:cytochrome c oxidase subunit 4